MRIGIKPGQGSLSVNELQRLWLEAEDSGFESIWTYEYLLGPLGYEAVTLLAALATLTNRVRIGCLVLANGVRQVGSLAAQLATVDALSGGRLEVGLGVGGPSIRSHFEALDIPFLPWHERIEALEHTVDRLSMLTAQDSPLGARPIQSPLPFILGGASQTIRQMAIERGLAWNLSSKPVSEFIKLKTDQPNPQAQVFLNKIDSVAETVATFREAGATRLVFVLQSPMTLADVRSLARDAGL